VKSHRYRITIEHIADKDGNAVERPPLQFEADNHDDMFEIVERVHGRGDFDGPTATALAVGLKLFSEVMLVNREHPLFTELNPHFRAFMKKLKKG